MPSSKHVTQPKTTEATPLREAIGLLTYRRQLLADAKRELSSARKRVRLCQKALQEAEWKVSAEVVASSTVVPMS